MVKSIGLLVSNLGLNLLLTCLNKNKITRYYMCAVHSEMFGVLGDISSVQWRLYSALADIISSLGDVSIVVEDPECTAQPPVHCTHVMKEGNDNCGYFSAATGVCKVCERRRCCFGSKLSWKFLNFPK